MPLSNNDRDRHSCSWLPGIGAHKTTMQGVLQRVFLSPHATIGPVNELDEQPAHQDQLPILSNQANINEWTTLPYPTKQVTTRSP
jgi:hypothetical protein